MLGAWRDPVIGVRLRALLRAAAGTDEGAALVRRLAEDVVIDQVSTMLSIPRLRVAGALSHLLGLALAAPIIGIEPLAGASDDELAALLTPAIRTYLG